jgi:integrase/recombinase XerD
LATTAIIESTETETENNFDRKLQLVTEGLQHSYANILQHKLPHKLSSVIIDYLLAMKTEKNLSLNYSRIIIKSLNQLARFTHLKDWKAIDRQDVLAFLDSYRRPEASDPMHKWIGTYNLYRIMCMTFFKWLHYPDIEGKRRPKPACIDNIPELRRKEESIYKPTDMWTQDDDLLFLKYCPSARDRCYHAISRDLSCRPAEILNLRISDVYFKLVGQNQYAETVVSGKTGQRKLPIINAIPYLKDWWDQHPQRANRNAFLIPTFHRKYFCRKMTVMGLHDIYCIRYRQKFFPKLLTDPSVPPEDKQRIKDLLQKPWNPYIRRHSAITEKSVLLKEHVLRQHAGWSPQSNMHKKYLHYYGNESSDSLLEAYGLVNPDERADIYSLKPLSCPNCKEPNKVDSKFCSKCRMILSYDAYEEMKEQQVNKNAIEELRGELEWLKGRAVMK